MYNDHKFCEGYTYTEDKLLKMRDKRFREGREFKHKALEQNICHGFSFFSGGRGIYEI